MLAEMRVHPDIVRSLPFLEYLAEWVAALPTLSMRDVVSQAGGPDRVAVVSVDLIKGFTHIGPLSSERIRGVVAPVVHLMRLAHEMGVRDFLCLQDAHPANSPEFDDFPPHCTEGSEEADMVDELAQLPFAKQFVVLPKRSISPLETGLDGWLDERRQLRRIVVVGDCTDLCVQQLAMHLKTRANARGDAYEVIVPSDCVDTYDLSVSAARQIGAMPHDGDLLHRVFLHHMALNGIEVVRRLE